MVEERVSFRAAGCWSWRCFLQSMPLAFCLPHLRPLVVALGIWKHCRCCNGNTFSRVLAWLTVYYNFQKVQQTSRWQTQNSCVGWQEQLFAIKWMITCLGDFLWIILFIFYDSAFMVVVWHSLLIFFFLHGCFDEYFERDPSSVCFQAGYDTWQNRWQLCTNAQECYAILKNNFCMWAYL